MNRFVNWGSSQLPQLKWHTREWVCELRQQWPKRAFGAWCPWRLPVYPRLFSTNEVKYLCSLQLCKWMERGQRGHLSHAAPGYSVSVSQVNFPYWSRVLVHSWMKLHQQSESSIKGEIPFVWICMDCCTTGDAALKMVLFLSPPATNNDPDLIGVHCWSCGIQTCILLLSQIADGDPGLIDIYWLLYYGTFDRCPLTAVLWCLW